MKTAFVFAGQGAQKEKMGQEFFGLNATNYPEIESLILTGTQEQLNQTHITQKAIALTSISIAKEVLKRVKPDYVLGLSLGEYSALWCSQVLSENDLLQTVTIRGNLMHQALHDSNSSMMAVLDQDIELIKSLTKDYDCWISNYNAPNQTVVSGIKDNLNKLANVFKMNHFRSIPLKVSGAFHSPLLKEASNKLETALDKIALKPQQIPVIFNVTGDTDDDKSIKDMLIQQLYSPVQFVTCINRAVELGVTKFIEIGPGTTNASLIKKISPNSKVFSINQLKDLEKLV